jgi:hypothetical protein
MSNRLVHLWSLAVVGLLMAGCGGTALGTSPEDTVSVSGLAGQSPILSPVATPAAVLAEVSPPMDLVVLHTNDNWGETEPCG